MINLTIQSQGKVTVFQCQGRILTREDTVRFRDALLSGKSPRISVLDLAQVESIDAGGLGLLLDLSKRTRSKGIHLKLVNITRRVRDVLELTNLDRVLEISLTSEIDASHASGHFDPDKAIPFATPTVGAIAASWMPAPRPSDSPCCSE